MKNAKYTEPNDYMPKDVRKALGLGEFAKDEKQKKETAEERKNANKKIRDFVNE